MAANSGYAPFATVFCHKTSVLIIIALCLLFTRNRNSLSNAGPTSKVAVTVESQERIFKDYEFFPFHCWFVCRKCVSQDLFRLYTKYVVVGKQS